MGGSGQHSVRTRMTVLLCIAGDTLADGQCGAKSSCGGPIGTKEAAWGVGTHGLLHFRRRDPPYLPTLRKSSSLPAYLLSFIL